MRAEAYWNLARSNERLCEYHKAVSYARHSLQVGLAVGGRDWPPICYARAHWCKMVTWCGCVTAREGGER